MMNKALIKNKTNVVVDQMLNMIMEGRFSAGDRIPPENELCAEFGVSRVTLRESLKQLCSMGVLTICQGKGTFVNRIAPSDLIESLMPLILLEMNDCDVDEIFEARIYLESGLAQVAAKNRTQEDLQKLGELLQIMNEFPQNKDFDRYNDLDLQFHTLIAEASKNKILIAMYMMLNEVRARSIRISNLSSASISYSIIKHEEILRALEQQDVANIASIMNTHLAFSRRMYKEVINSSRKKIKP